MTRVRTALLYALCLPADLVCWAAVLTMHILFGDGPLVWRNGVLTTELRAECWPAQLAPRWNATTPFGHGIIFTAGRRALGVVWRHELVHVEQFEACGALGTVCAAVLLALGARWELVPAACLLSAWVYVAGLVTAKLRGEPDAYLGNFLEEAGYAEQDKGPGTGE